MAKKKMKQLIARIDPELHARLKARAKAEGRSMNSVVAEALEAAAEREPPEETLRERAKRLGIPLVGGYDPPPGKAERERRNAERRQAAELGAGKGPILVDLVLRERRRRG